MWNFIPRPEIASSKFSRTFFGTNPAKNPAKNPATNPAKNPAKNWLPYPASHGFQNSVEINFFSAFRSKNGRLRSYVAPVLPGKVCFQTKNGQFR
jgi:hypothetical protein